MNAVAALSFSSLLLFSGPGGDLKSSVTPLANNDLSYGQAQHLLMRAGFGGSPEQIRKLQQMGLRAAVRYLVDYERLPQGFDHRVTPPEPIARGTYRKLSQDERRNLNRIRAAQRSKAHP